MALSTRKLQIGATNLPVLHDQLDNVAKNEAAENALDGIDAKVNSENEQSEKIIDKDVSPENDQQLNHLDKVIDKNMIAENEQVDSTIANNILTRNNQLDDVCDMILVAENDQDDDAVSKILFPEKDNRVGKFGGKPLYSVNEVVKKQCIGQDQPVDNVIDGPLVNEINPQNNEIMADTDNLDRNYNFIAENNVPTDVTLVASPEFTPTRYNVRSRSSPNFYQVNTRSHHSSNESIVKEAIAKTTKEEMVINSVNKENIESSKAKCEDRHTFSREDVPSGLHLNATSSEKIQVGCNSTSKPTSTKTKRSIRWLEADSRHNPLTHCIY